MPIDDKPVEQVIEHLQNLKVDAQTNVGDTSEVTLNIDHDVSDSGVDSSTPSEHVDMGAGVHAVYINADVYCAANYNAMPHGYYFGGYEYPISNWEDYLQHNGIDNLEVQELGSDIFGVYDETGTMLYQTGGFGYTPVYGLYITGAPFFANGQLYNQTYPYPAHIYQQPIALGAQLTSSASSAISDDTINATDFSNQGINHMSWDLVNENNTVLGSRTPYPVALLPSVGPYGPTMLPSTISIPASQDDKVTDCQQIHAMSEPFPVIWPLGQTQQHEIQAQMHMSAGQSLVLFSAAPLLGASSQFYQSPAIPFSGFASGRGQWEGLNGFDSGGNGSAWAFDRGNASVSGTAFICNRNENADVLNEQNRGPRTSRIRNQKALPGTFSLKLSYQDAVVNEKSDVLGPLGRKYDYNRSDFSTNYETAKFFIIKSYSEDDIHKSIKYNVWASTPNGNKKLDTAYKEAQEKAGYCPVFLFFSVNASGQFCGLAEMVGAVDFSKNMDFWQQDKWNGRFSVKWHIIKDVPNSRIRHIILANNDNKPVTNSRDTQEVNFLQGIDMLNLFKNYKFKTSILDDFQFYEARQKAMQERKSRQQQTQCQLMIPHGCASEADLHTGPSPYSADEKWQSEGDGNTSQLNATSVMTSRATQSLESISIFQTAEKQWLTRVGMQLETGDTPIGSKNLDE